MKIIHKTSAEMTSEDRQVLVKGILSAAYLIKRHQENILDKYGITLVKYHILQVLASAAPAMLSQNEIRERIIDKTIDLPRIAKQMDSMCLITRGRLKGNKRVSETTITPKGLEMLKEIAQSMDDMNLATIHLSDEEVLQMTALVQKMTDVLTEAAGPAPETKEGNDEALEGTDGAIIETEL